MLFLASWTGTGLQDWADIFAVIFGFCSIITAISAVFIAAGQAKLAGEQAEESRRHTRLSVRPKLILKIAISSDESVAIDIENKGLGPATIYGFTANLENKTYNFIRTGGMNDWIRKLEYIGKINPKRVINEDGYVVSVNEKLRILEFSESEGNTLLFEALKQQFAKTTFEVKYRSFYNETFSAR
ncbi:MAG: hypothetical protein ACPGN3_12475 [Opitutales bacterium]